MSLRTLVHGSIAGVLLAAPMAAQAVLIGGVEFPQGAVSFADSVVSYTLGTGAVTSPHQGSANAVGQPDYTGTNSCPSQAGCSFVSLGSGGSITLRFTDNRLTGSGSAALDLWVFEVGPDVEDTFVEISKDGITYSAVGKVFGSTAGIDIDAFGFGLADEFAYVRLTDDANEGGTGGATAGADIDAVGAISTVRRGVPEPAGLALFGIGLAAFALGRRR